MRKGGGGVANKTGEQVNEGRKKNTFKSKITKKEHLSIKFKVEM